MPLEIERKYKLDRFPENLPELTRAAVEQGYLCTRPTVRIRSKCTAEGTTYELCFKGEGKLAREEIEMPLTAEQFGQLRSLVRGPLNPEGLPGLRAARRQKARSSLVDEGRRPRFCMPRWNFPRLPRPRPLPHRTAWAKTSPGSRGSAWAATGAVPAAENKGEWP